MRVTQFTQYNNFILNQQKTLNALNETQTQISTGEKIQNMYEDPVVYTKYLQLNEEINSFSQIKFSANFAQTFANETDTTLNDFVSTLGSFKTKLLSAANATNDNTSRQAIVSELKGELAHLKDLANTSIDGKYIFSGNKFNTKPVDDNYQYQGNDAKVKAFLGSGVEREYNIDGASLFLGRDNDYVKHISTNVVQFDKMKANPEFVVRGNDGNLYIDKHIKEHGKNPDSEDVPKNEPVTGESQIRMLTGVEDEYVGNGKYKDGTSYFYIKGRKPSGETFSTKFLLSNSDSVNNLLKKIGEIYGNTAVSKVVDVSLNDMGQIQIKDIQSGKMLTDFYMVASDKDEDSIEDMVKKGAYIVEFQKSDFKGVKSLNTITANNEYFDNRVFKFGSKFILDDNSREALPNDLLDKILGDGITENNKISKPEFIQIKGTDTDGASVDGVFDIYDSSGNPKKMADLLNEIKTLYGGDDKVSVSLEEGEIVITDKTLQNDNDTSNITVHLTAYEDTDNDGAFNSSNDKKIDVFRDKDIANKNKNYFKKNGNTLTSNVSQVIKDKTVYFKNGEKITRINDIQTYASDNTVLMDTIGDENLPKNINIDFKDINGNYKKAKIELRDSIKSMAAVYKTDGQNNNIIIDPTGNSNINDNYYKTVGATVIDGVGNPIKVNYLKISDGSTTKEIAIDDATTFKHIVDNSGGLLTGYDNGKFLTANTNVTVSLQHEYKADNNNELDFDTSAHSNPGSKVYDVTGKYMSDENGNKVEIKYLYVANGSNSTEISISDNTTIQNIINNSGGLLKGYKDGKFITSDSNVKIVLRDASHNPSNSPNNILSGFKSNYQIDLNNDGKIGYGETFNIFDQNGKLTPAHTQINTYSKIDTTTCKLCQKEEISKGMTYRQLGDVVSMLTSNNVSPSSPDVYSESIQLSNDKVNVSVDDKGRLNLRDKTSKSTDIELAIYGTSVDSSHFSKITDEVNDSGSNQTFSIDVDGVTYSLNVSDGESVKTFIDDINNGNLKDSSGNSLNVKAFFKNGSIYLDFTDVEGSFKINDSNLKTNFKFRDDNSLYFQANNAVTVDTPQVDFFDMLQKAIEAVKNGNNHADSNALDPRNSGIQGAIESIDHVTDHVRRMHAKIGAVSNEFGLTIERTDMLKLNVQQLQSENIDTDLGEATMKLNSLQVSYQALLASIAKVNKLTLLNYL